LAVIMIRFVALYGCSRTRTRKQSFVSAHGFLSLNAGIIYRSKRVKRVRFIWDVSY